VAEALILRWQSAKQGGKGWKLSPQENALFTTDHLGIPPRQIPILTFKNGSWVLGIPRGLEGEIEIEKEVSTLSQLRAGGKLKEEGNYETFLLPPTFSKALLKFPEGELLIHPESQKPAAAPPPRAPAEEPPALRKIQTERQRRDRWFALILLFLLSIHALLILFLVTRKVPEIKPLEVTQIPERYAEIIVPPKPPETPKTPTKVETKPAPGPEGGGGGEPPPGEGKEKDKPPGPKSREEILQKVRTKGVLAVLTAKGKGGALANLLVWASHVHLQDRLSSLQATANLGSYPVGLGFAAFCGAGAAYGAVCSALSLRKAMRQTT